jgi:predicted NUDIX family NTP pyrophosphohydrolase
MARQSAGLLLFREISGRLEVLLVHPGGPFWAKKNVGAWSIPKGELFDAEDPLRAAVREVGEELGEPVNGEFIPLQPQRQAGGKTVHAWAVRSDFNPAHVRSNTFSMEWPPRSGREQTFHEVDRAEWFDLDAARTKILNGQVGFINELERKVGVGEKPRSCKIRSAPSRRRMRPWISLSTVLNRIALSRPLATLASLHDPSDEEECKGYTIIYGPSRQVFQSAGFPKASFSPGIRHECRPSVKSPRVPRGVVDGVCR